jgi:DNA polymerase III gamma/tau subunit
VQFEKPTVEQMVNSLKRIVEGEKLKVDKEVLEKIAKVSDGAFRDAAKNLEELVLNSNNKPITKELFDTTFKTQGVALQVYELLKSYEVRDAKKALETIAKLEVSGVDFKTVIERLVDHLRGLLMLRNGIPSEEKDIEGLTVSNIKDLLTLSNEAYSELRLSVIPQLPLELMSVKFCIIDSPKENQESGIRSQKAEEQGVLRPVIARNEMTKQSQTISQKPEKIDRTNILPRLIDVVNMANKPAAALLRSCKGAVLEGETLTISTPFPIHAERLKSEKVLPDLLKSAETFLGKNIEIAIKIATL